VQLLVLEQLNGSAHACYITYDITGGSI